MFFLKRSLPLFGFCLTILVATTAIGQELLVHRTFDGPDAQTGNVHGATATDGVAGGALAFDGIDDYVNLGDLGEQQAATVAFWMNPKNVEQADQWQGLVTSDAWEAGVMHVSLRDCKIEVYLHMGEMNRGRLSSLRLRNGTWYHVAVTVDTESGKMRLYLNGFEQAEDDMARLQTPLKLIRQVVGREASDGDTRYFQGAIDDARIYDRALSAEDVRALCPDADPPAGYDPRNIITGVRIPDQGYCDQPYVVVQKDGSWLCVLTTGPGYEGQGGQHVVSTVSTDQGRTWSPIVDIEPADGPEASWVVPLLVPGGRVYAFYDYNGEKVDTLNGNRIRADMLGWYCYKYSDDGGRSWSAQRYRLPMRVTACDRANDWQGEVQIFWGICKPLAAGDDVYFAFTKLGKYMLENGEGWIYHSDNILTENDVEKIHWELLPEGENGIRAPQFGSVQEEHNLVWLGGERLYCVYRTTTGYPCHTYSDDGGRSWLAPIHMTYQPDGRKMKNPRACPKLWKTADGRYLFWFHNHSGQSFADRNPAWIAGGVQRDGRIYWSQPEVLLYDDNPKVRMSYPDLIQQDGKYWITETQKTVARIHAIDSALLEGLWGQLDEQPPAGPVEKGCIATLDRPIASDGSLDIPQPLDLTDGGGFSIEFWLTAEQLEPGRVILDARSDQGDGWAISTGENHTLKFELSDGQATASWDLDPGALEGTGPHHVVFIVDGGPRIITTVVDGQLSDGGQTRQYGWGRFPADLGDVSGSGTVTIAPDGLTLGRVRIYDRYLRTSEAIRNYRAGMGAK